MITNNSSFIPAVVTSSSIQVANGDNGTYNPANIQRTMYNINSYPYSTIPIATNTRAFHNETQNPTSLCRTANGQVAYPNLIGQCICGSYFNPVHGPNVQFVAETDAIKSQSKFNGKCSPLTTSVVRNAQYGVPISANPAPNGTSFSSATSVYSGQFVKPFF